MIEKYQKRDQARKAAKVQPLSKISFSKKYREGNYDPMKCINIYFSNDVIQNDRFSHGSYFLVDFVGADEGMVL